MARQPDVLAPYHFLLHYAGSELAAVLLSIALGTLSMVLVYVVLSRRKATMEFRLLAIGIAVISPTLLSIFSSVDSRAAAFTLVLLCGVLFTSQRIYTLLLSLPLLLVLGLLSPLYLAFAAALFLGVSVRAGRQTIILFGTLFALNVALFVAALVNGRLAQVFFDFGRSDGLSVFLVVLSLAGALALWNRRYQMREFFVALLTVTALFWVDSALALPFLALAAAVLGAFALAALWHRRWEVPLIRNVTILVIFCGLLFSTLSFLGSIEEQGPSPLLVSDYRSFNQQGAVVSAPSRGAWIRYYTDLEPQEETNETAALFRTRNLAQARALLNGSDYLLIDDKMRHGQVWSKPEDGLLFLLRNNETFAIEQQGVVSELWRIR